MQPEQLATVQPISGESKSDEQVQTLLNLIQEKVGETDFKHWFAGQVSVTTNDDQLSVGVGSPFVLTWVQRRFRIPLTKVAQQVLGDSASVEFHVDPAVAALAVKKNLPQSAGNNQADNNQLNVVAENASSSSRSNHTAAKSLNHAAASVTQRSRRYASLQSYVPGKTNLLPLTAIKQVCESPGLQFNPLFLYGGVGNGKSHLLESVYLETRRLFPALRTVLLGAESFANYFTKALREHSLPAFRQRFRNVDVLLVDDVDFLEGKKGIQEEFLHTIQHLEGHQRQIVLTADRHPRLLSRTNEELTSRFASGLLCRVETPDFEGRLEIAHRKMDALKANVTDEALAYTARRFKNNVRELEGALNCLATHYVLLKQPIHLGAAKKMLSDLERDCFRMVNLSDVEKTITSFFGLKSEDLKSSCRQRTVSQPRMLAMFLARKHTKAAYSEIGRYFGGRNHSTVMSAEKKVDRWLNSNEEITVARQSWTTNDLLEALEQQLVAS